MFASKIRRYIPTTFSRPADATVYAAGDEISNSATAGSVVRPTIDLSNVRKARIVRAGIAVTPASGNLITAALDFALHVWKTKDVPAAVGDNVAWNITALQRRLAAKFTFANNAWTAPNGAAGVVAITGFEITGTGATGASTITVTVTGILGGTKSYLIAIPAGAGTSITPLVVEFSRPIPAAAPGTAIVVNVPSFGAGNLNAAVTAHGVQSDGINSRDVDSSATGAASALTATLAAPVATGTDGFQEVLPVVRDANGNVFDFTAGDLQTGTGRQLTIGLQALSAWNPTAVINAFDIALDIEIEE